MSVLAVQAALAAPIAVRAESTDVQPPFPDWYPTLPFEREYGDKLAWYADSPDNTLEDFPGAGWNLPESDQFEPTPADVDALHLGDADHDGQFDPNAVELWAQRDADYWRAEYDRWAEQDEVEREAHNAEARGFWSARFPLIGHPA